MALRRNMASNALRRWTRSQDGGAAARSRRRSSSSQKRDCDKHASASAGRGRATASIHRGVYAVGHPSLRRRAAVDGCGACLRSRGPSQSSERGGALGAPARRAPGPVRRCRSRHIGRPVRRAQPGSVCTAPRSARRRDDASRHVASRSPRRARTIADLEGVVAAAAACRRAIRQAEIAGVPPRPEVNTRSHAQRSRARLPATLPPPRRCPRPGGQRPGRALDGRLPLALAADRGRDRRLRLPPGLASPSRTTTQRDLELRRHGFEVAPLQRSARCDDAAAADVAADLRRRASALRLIECAPMAADAPRALPDRRQLARLPGLLRAAGVDRDQRRAADQRDLRARLDAGQDHRRAPPGRASSSPGTPGCPGARSPTTSTRPSANRAPTCCASSGRT